jgi:hypothetical protein
MLIVTGHSEKLDGLLVSLPTLDKVTTPADVARFCDAMEDEFENSRMQLVDGSWFLIPDSAATTEEEVVEAVCDPDAELFGWKLDILTVDNDRTNKRYGMPW